MRKINIVAGTYGYRKDGTSPVELIDSKSGPIEVADKEADRLIGLGVAEEAEEVTEAQTEEMKSGYPDAEDMETAEALEEYSIAELKELAGEMRLEVKPRMTKKELIRMISDAEAKAPAADDTKDEEADNDEPPVLSAADPE